jgi:hypothetical protein
VPVPFGQTYDPPDYVHRWQQDYIAAVKATKAAGKTKGEYGAIDVKAVLAHMRANRGEGGAGQASQGERRAAGETAGAEERRRWRQAASEATNRRPVGAGRRGAAPLSA